jgi:hypothetical protein
MLENSFELDFCLTLPCVKNDRSAGAIYRRVAVNRPRGTIPIQIWHLSGFHLVVESDIKYKTTAQVLQFSFIVLVKHLRHEGQ